MVKIAIMFFVNLTFQVNTGYARDPDALPRDYEYGEHQTVGGKHWTGADTFVLCGVAVMAAMVFALPQIFDGEDQDWPVHKFSLFNNIEQHRVLNKFPTRSLCGSY